MGRRIMAAGLALCAACLLIGMTKSAVLAESESAGTALSGNVELLRQDGDNYIMQVTVENTGEDFSGTVQVIFQAYYSAGNCAYNTEIALPSQGRKQFTLTVPENALDATQGEAVLNFLNTKGKTVASFSLKDLTNGVSSGLLVGVLSDDYSSLAYLDAGGERVYAKGENYPLNLIPLNQDDLLGYLGGLHFLVIDQFNVASLGADNIQAIEQWVSDGGWLLVGTGAYAEQTLSGFDEDFLDMQLWEILEPGEESVFAKNHAQHGYYSSYWDVDFTQMTFAQLDYISGYGYESTDNPAAYRDIGDGAAAIYYNSLGDAQMQNLSDYAVEYIYEELMHQSQSYYNFNRSSQLSSYGQRLLAYIGNRNAGVDFSALKWLIGLYVLLVGPTLYLILRKCKKSEWYWVGAPALGLLFVLGVFLLGRGARVNETRVYSITAQRADGDWADSYFMAYHSGVRPWKVLLAEDYEIAGPGWNGYEGKYLSGAGEYFYTVDYDSKGLSVGEKPRENFENGFFYAGGHTEARGTIAGSIKEISSLAGGIEGTVTNGTDCDLAYLAVWNGQDVMIFEDVKAGETLDIKWADAGGRCVYRSGGIEELVDLFWDVTAIPNRSAQGAHYTEEEITALYLGLGVALEESPGGEDRAIIAGLVKDGGRVTAGKCNETSYQCLYGYGKMEG